MYTNNEIKSKINWIIEAGTKADEIIASKDPKKIYFYAQEHANKDNVNKFADAIIETKSADYIYFFARFIVGAPIEKLANAIIDSKNSEYTYMFARYVKDAPVEKLSTAIIESGNPEYIFLTAKYTKSAPIYKLAEGIVKTQNINYIYLFSTEVKGMSVEKMMIMIDESNLQQTFFMKEVKERKNFSPAFIKTFLNKMSEKDIHSLIGFIKENKDEIGNYDKFSINLLANMKKDLNKYKDFLSIYIDYIIDPTKFNDEDLKVMNTEYEQLIESKKVKKKGSLFNNVKNIFNNK